MFRLWGWNVGTLESLMLKSFCVVKNKALSFARPANASNTRQEELEDPSSHSTEIDLGPSQPGGADRALGTVGRQTHAGRNHEHP